LGTERLRGCVIIPTENRTNSHINYEGDDVQIFKAIMVKYIGI
jgi:hypothetical protein